MLEFVRALVVWWNRRRRFAEEWSFHLGMATSELEALGLSRREARQFAARRLGSRPVHRRQAMQKMGADARGLLELLPIRCIQRSAWLFPCVMAAAVGLVLACNPGRRQVLASLYFLLPFSGPAQVERMIPLPGAGTVPIGFATLTLWTLVLVGLARIAVRLTLGAGWRICIYAGVVLCEVAVLGGVCWATGLQILLRWKWSADLIQGLTLGLFLVAYSWSTYWAMRFWWSDVERRCPDCLRLPGMPEVRGKPHDILIEPLEVESICLHGHGLTIESRWRSRFERNCSLDSLS